MYFLINILQFLICVILPIHIADIVRKRFFKCSELLFFIGASIVSITISLLFLWAIPDRFQIPALLSILIGYAIMIIGFP